MQPAKAPSPSAIQGKSKPAQIITLRAVLLGVITVIGFTVAGCFSVFLRYEIIGTGYLPRGAIALLMIFVLLNALVGLFARRIRLSRNELLLVFVMLLAMAAIPGQEYVQHFYLNLVGVVYYTTPDIADPEVYLDDLNPLLVPSLDRESPAIRWAFEGVPPGQRIPYGAWTRPLLVWTPYFFAVYWMLLCFAGVLSARWEDDEKLLYPLMQVPDEMTEVPASGGFLASLMRDKMMWTCFAISCILYILKGVHTYVPTFPDINLQQTTQRLFAGGPAVAFNNVPLHFYPEMIGIAYLLTAEVSFSLWFFYIFRLFQAFFRYLFGINTNPYSSFELQTAGGYVVLALALLWSARKHLNAVFSYAFGLSGAPKDNRLQPYRLCAIGFVAGFAFIMIWAYQVGMNLGWALLLFGLLPLVGMVVSRVICEAGMFIYSTPFRLNELIFNVFGTQNIGAKNITLMTAASWVQVRSTATQFMPQAFQGLKLSSLAGFNRIHMVWVMMLGIVVAILTSHVVSPYVIYTWGVPKLGWWPRGSSLGTTNRLVSFILNPTEMTPGDWISLGSGGLLTAFLVMMRQRFLWWPFHPAGYVAFLGWPTERYWMSIFLGWLAKTVVLRFFGFKTFAALRPAAFGFILGICFILTAWLVFHFFLEGPPVLIE